MPIALHVTVYQLACLLHVFFGWLAAPCAYHKLKVAYHVEQLGCKG